jgi:hypothetical protein
MNESFPKFQISKFLDSKRDYQVVVRTDTVEELISAMEAIKPLIKSMETTPTASKTAEHESLHCDYHDCEMKLNKNGKPYHTKGTYPDLIYCNGYGFPEDKADWKAKQQYQNK